MNIILRTYSLLPAISLSQPTLFSPKSCICTALPLLLLLGSITATQARQCTYRTAGTGGNWTTTSTWTPAGGGCQNYPGQVETNDIVIIQSGDNVILNAGGSITVASIRLVGGAGSNDTELTISGTDLRIAGLYTIEAKSETNIQNGSNIVIEGDIFYNGNNGNINVDGNNTNTLLVLGCIDKASGNASTGIITGGLTWCVGNNGAECSGQDIGGQGGAGDCTSLLPISLAFFQSKLTDQGVELYWQTSNEINNDYFEIQRSANGVDFEAIGTVDGFGNTELPQSYRFLDPEILDYTAYYRLKQVDFDGAYSYSPVVVANTQESHANEEEAKVWVYNKQLKVEAPALDNAQIGVYNAWGQLVESTSIEGNISKPSITISMANMPQGVYIVKIVQKGEKVISKKMMLR